MKIRTFVLAMGIMLFGAVACDKPQPEPEPQSPEISVEESSVITGKGGEYSIPFELKNAPEGAKVTASTDVDWIFEISASGNELKYTVSDNLGARRSAKITLKYGEDESASVVVTQNTFEFSSFTISVSNITTSGVSVNIRPKEYQNNYFFEVIGKSYVDRFVAMDEHSVGDMEYGEAYYQDDLEFLMDAAKAGGHSLEHHLMMSPSMYKVTSRGESTEIDYSSLTPEVDYYVVVYGMDFSGARTTEVCLYQFTTASPNYSSLILSGSASNVTQTSARITITPSNNSEYYYWTYVNETEYLQYTPEFIQTNMVQEIRSAVSAGYPVDTFLSKGQEIYDAKEGEFTMGTTYTVFAWGMDANLNITTRPQELFSFTTKANDVTDDCMFTVDVLEIEPMDVKLKVTPSNEETKYYVAVIDEKRCVGYNDFQMVTRVINMENSRMEGKDYTWANHPDLMSGVHEVWGRKDLLWTFEPEHSYRIYVFGMDSEGNCSTGIYRSDVTTAGAQPSNITFNVSMSKDATWHYAAFDITPSNNEDYYMPFLIETSELETYRYADGSLMEREVMDQIRDIYEDEITQYVYAGSRTYYTPWSSDRDYSLLLFGYAGTNTTEMFEFKFRSPEIPIGKADSDISYTYEIFNGADLVAMNPVVWKDCEDDCIMKVNIKVTGNPENYYFGVWPPKENFASTGGMDQLLILCQNELTTGDNIINKNFGILKPWWNGSGMSDGLFVTDEGETLPCMPWSITAYTEDADHNYGRLHYEMFIPRKKPAAEVTGKYEIGYREPYDFWSSPSSEPGVTTLIMKAGKPETLTNIK